MRPRTFSPRENFLRMIWHDRPQWLPLAIGATPPVVDMLQKHTGTRKMDEVFGLDFRGVGVGFPTRQRDWREAYARLGVNLPDNAEVGWVGITHLRPPDKDLGRAYHLRELMHPLAAIADVGQLGLLPWPDLGRPSGVQNLFRRVRQIHARGLVAVGGLECTIFEHTWYLRGMDNVFLDLAEGTGISDWLMDWFMNRSIQAARWFARAGVDVIALGDDVGTQRGMMIRADDWRRILKPRLKAVIDAIREVQARHVYVRYHSDGDVRQIIPDLIEIGVDILNPVQPECLPPAEVVPQYKDRLNFWGLVGTQTTMPFGTPADVRSVIEQCAQFARDGAGIVVAPTHVLEPEVPWENILALVDAVRRNRI